ncbi:MAG: hypothetical protein ACXAC5_03870 [Promethearchaeota archaeon]|jgi:hypothetical protein
MDEDKKKQIQEEMELAWERFWNEDKRFWVRAEKLTWAIILSLVFWPTFLAYFLWPFILIDVGIIWLVMELIK